MLYFWPSLITDGLGKQWSNSMQDMNSPRTIRWLYRCNDTMCTCPGFPDGAQLKGQPDCSSLSGGQALLRISCTKRPSLLRRMMRTIFDA
jgi:hypothetical protein